MTAVMERPAASREIGSMTPRIFTPPLPEHCTGPQVDPLLDDERFKDHYDYGVPLECPCGCGLNPTTSWGFSANRFAKDILRRKLLPYQQWLNIHCLEKDDEDGGFRFKILVVLISRQQGKTFWLQQLGLWRLFLSPRGRTDASCPGASLALIAAQNLQYAEGMLKEVVDEIRDNRFLSPELVNHRVTNGNHRLILTNRRYWRAATATRKGGRSLTVDIAMLDELREHVTTEAWDAITPTTTTKKFSQIVCTSNAGDKRSIVLRGLRDQAIRRITTKETSETKTGLFEWSVPMDVDPADDSYWYMANPSLGNLNAFKLADLRAMFEAQQYRNLPGFQTEHLCQWVDALEPGIIPAERWAETVDKASRRAEGSPLYVGVDINYERSRAFIAAAARRADGNLHIEIINAARGTDWVIPWLCDKDNAGMDRRKKFQGVAIQKTGAPISGMLEDFRRAGIPVVEWGPGVELAGGCNLFYDGICENKIYHVPSPVLDRAAASGVSRNVGEGWVFDRRNSPVDVSPLIACAAATWLEHRPPAGVPELHAWPDEDVIAQWEKEAEEKFSTLPKNSEPQGLNDIEGTRWWRM